MITCHRSFVERLAVERNRSLADLMPCIVQADGDAWTVDTEHPAYPKPEASSFGFGQFEPVGGNGPGTELHALLGKFGIRQAGDCKCSQRVAYLDQQGCDWAEANIDEIVGWLRESAAERGLPFLDVAARLLVKRAISNARRKEAARGTEDRPPLHVER